MEMVRKLELLDRLRNKFDDYIDFYDLVECLPEMTDAKIISLKSQRTKNGLVEFSYWTNKNKGTLMVSASKFEQWVLNNFKSLDDS